MQKRRTSRVWIPWVPLLWLAAAAQAAPRGVYAVAPWSQAPATRTWENPLVDGVVVRTTWAALEPHRDLCDWSLDGVFRSAAAHGKKIHLIVEPGFHSPEWLLRDAAVRKGRFSAPRGPFDVEGLERELPVPWEDRYLARWLDFVARLGARYRDKPELACVSVSGPNASGGDVSLPRAGPDSTRWLELAGGSAVRLESLLLGAWTRVLAGFCEAFRGKTAILSIAGHSFPLMAGSALEMKYERELCELAVERCAGGIGLEATGLDARPVHPAARGLATHWRLVAEFAGKAAVGFAARAPRFPRWGGGSREAAVSRKRAEFSQLLSNARELGATFLEIPESEGGDRDLADLLKQARSWLAR